MTELFSERQPSYSPLHLGEILLSKQEHEKGFDTQKAGDIIDIDGAPHELIAETFHVRDRRTGEWCEVPYTYRGYYSHHDPKTYEPGPGWDYRWGLANESTAMAKHGRTFTSAQIENPSLYMPDTPVFLARPVDS